MTKEEAINAAVWNQHGITCEALRSSQATGAELGMKMDGYRARTEVNFVQVWAQAQMSLLEEQANAAKAGANPGVPNAGNQTVYEPGKKGATANGTHNRPATPGRV